MIKTKELQLPKIDPQVEYQRKKDKERKKSTKKDIERITTALESNDMELMKEIHKAIDAKYNPLIINWEYCMNFYNPNFGFDFYDITQDEIIENLKVMIAKLETYITGDNMVTHLQKEYLHGINVSVNNTNSNTNELSVSITFEKAREQIKEMTSLTDEQTNEVLDRITEIENTFNGEGTKKSKWEKIKPILIWLADKSFDVGMTLLPLLLKLQECN